MDIKVGRKAIEEASKKLSNWGRWGKDDHIGTLNLVTPTEVAAAASRDHHRLALEDLAGIGCHAERRVASIRMLGRVRVSAMVISRSMT